jgi:hypothetical protein
MDKPDFPLNVLSQAFLNERPLPDCQPASFLTHTSYPVKFAGFGRVASLGAVLLRGSICGRVYAAR